jgi:PAS domain S-box-containing protein
MSVAHQFRDDMKFRVNSLFQNTIFRYLFGIAAVASVFALRIWLIPLTGTGAPYVLFFAAVLVTSLFAGVGPAICAVLLSMPLGAYTFVAGAGYSIGQASFQSLLFAVDGIVVIYLTLLARKWARSLHNANRQARASEEKYHVLFDSIDEGFCVVEVLFDDADHARDYRFLEVNRVFEKQTGISNAVGRRMREIAPAHEEHWFQIYGQIALTGEARRFENPAHALGRFYDVYAFRVGRPEQRQVAILFNDITERKQTEEALRRTQALNQAVLGSVAANIAVLDREGNIIAVNEAWKRFAYENDGAAVADCVGVNYLQVCRDAPESGDGGWAALTGIQAVLDGTRHNFVLEYPCHSPREKRWFLMSVTPLLGERGGAVVTHTDITTRKQIEEALHESEERLELAMEAGGIGTFDWNIRTNAVVWTEPSKAAFARASGASRGVYDDWAKRVHPEDLLVCEASIQEVFRQKHDHWQAEYRMMRSDTAEERWINAQSRIVYDAEGEPLRMIGVNIDITERKRIERTLQESEERFRLTIDEAPIGMALEALDGRFVRVNRVLCEIVGYSSAELTGLTFQAITHPDDLDADLALKGQLARGEIPRYQLGKRYIRKDGAIVDIQLDCSILRTREGAPLHYIAQIEDITDRKRAEAALKDSERRLSLALDSAQMGMWDLDLLTDTSVRSLRHDQIFGYSAAVPTWGAAVFMTHVVPEDRDVARYAFEKAFVSDNFEMECRIRWADQSIHWISAKGRVYRNPTGDPVRMLGTVLDITERKRAEEALRGVSAELRQTLVTAGTGLTHCSRDLRYLTANPAYGRLVGLPVEQIVGRPIIDVMGHAAFEIIRPRVERVLSGERVEYEDELPIAGERRWIHAVYTPDRDASGNVAGWVASVIDMTVRKRIEEELRAANAFLDAIIENIPLMLFIKESQALRFIRVNRTGEDLLGWPNQTLIGKTAYDFWPKKQAEFFIAKDRETLTNGSVVDIPEEPIQTRHQGVRILHTKKVPILDTAGNPIYLLGISEDITERSRIEREQRFLAEASVVLSASLDHEQTLATVARLAVQDVADWCVVDVMEEQGQLRRLKVATADPAKAALCVVLEQMPPERDLPHLMRSVMESKRPMVVEHVTPQYLDSLAQGPEHLQALLAAGILSFVAVPLLLRGQSLGAMLLGSSTPFRVFGQGDLRLAEALADRAAVAIQNARLYRASVHATQLRDQVLGVVAHDLRNPLSTILMQTSALKRQGPESERRSQKPMEVIHRGATRMNRLIQDLLDVARMEAGQLPIERARLSAGGLIAEAVDMQRPLASSSSLELRVEVDPDVAEVWGDRNRLLQVFENLIGNAIKFTQAGGRITAGATSRDDEVVFWVADTGSGIASENLPHVFDRFWQATRTGRQGAGLGLPITKGIVEAHGGRIWVESTAGSGSTFFFTIPRVSAAEERLSDRRRRDRVA